MQRVCAQNILAPNFAVNAFIQTSFSVRKLNLRHKEYIVNTFSVEMCPWDLCENVYGKGDVIDGYYWVEGIIN